MSLLGYVVLAFVLLWIVHDPTGAANTAAYVVHALGVAASSLAHQLSIKTGLTGAAYPHRGMQPR